MSYVNRRGRGRGSSGSGGGGNQSYRGDRGITTGSEPGSSYNSNRRTETNRNPRAPIILAKPQHDRRGSGGRDSNDVDGYEQRPPRSENRRQVLARKDSSTPVVEDSRRIASPRPLPQSTSASVSESSKPQAKDVSFNPNDYIPPRNLKLVDDNQFCEHFYDYLNENSTDFVVVGVIGTTSVGKSTILNALINPASIQQQPGQKSSIENGHQTNGSTPMNQRMFRVQTFEKQMLSEHCTNGINAWIDASRVAYLDSQALFSNSVLDRSAQLEKKYSFEFSGAENTSEIHSLQFTGFFMSICHVVFVVQEGAYCDPDLIEKLKISELLRPSVMASRSVDESDKLIEYSPEIIFIHNKVRDVDFGPQTYAKLRDEYEYLFKEGGFNFRCRTNLSSDNKTDGINLVLLPDIKDPDRPSDFLKCISKLKQALSLLQPHPFISDVKKGQNEKLWFQHTKKMWDQIKTSNFYLEYSRILRQRSV